MCVCMIKYRVKLVIDWPTVSYVVVRNYRYCHQLQSHPYRVPYDSIIVATWFLLIRCHSHSARSLGPSVKLSAVTVAVCCGSLCRLGWWTVENAVSWGSDNVTDNKRQSRWRDWILNVFHFGLARLPQRSGRVMAPVPFVETTACICCSFWFVLFSGYLSQ